MLQYPLYCTFLFICQCKIKEQTGIFGRSVVTLHSYGLVGLVCDCFDITGTCILGVLGKERIFAPPLVDESVCIFILCGSASGTKVALHQRAAFHDTPGAFLDATAVPAESIIRHRLRYLRWPVVVHPYVPRPHNLARLVVACDNGIAGSAA